MCGIAGILSFDGRPAQKQIVHKMSATLAHRGPDDHGVWVNGPVGLGHTRLSILDTSDAGHQPMSTDDGKIQIVFNGEIYNWEELKAELQSHGYVFRSNCDTEVILQAYKKWGRGCLQHFAGMFAFALWDDTDKSLWLVRDRIGIKPLFYSLDKHHVLFGSEIKAILAHPEVTRSPDFNALSYFLSLNYMPAPSTLFSRIRQVMPSTYLVISQDGKCREHQYWDLHFPERNSASQKSQDEWRERLTSELKTVVGQHMRSDVPYGAFLSGGVDSSTLAALMKEKDASTSTFCVGFDSKSYDERPYARMVANHLQTMHHEVEINPDPEATLFQLIKHAEEPTADSSMFASYHLSKFAREHVTVALSGDGADELFAGYETYTATRLAILYRRLPAAIRNKIIAPLIEALPVSNNNMSLEFKLKRFVKSAGSPYDIAHASWRMISDAEDRCNVLHPDLRASYAQADGTELYAEQLRHCKSDHALEKMLYADTRFYLPNDMLVKMDRTSMAHGLEVRVPFLDHRIVELAAQIPPQLKLRHLTQKKYILKDAMKTRLPSDILNRKKAGFNVPIGPWLRGPLKQLTTDLLLGETVSNMGWLDASHLQSMVTKHLNNEKNFSYELWGVLTLVMWWRHHMAQ